MRKILVAVGSRANYSSLKSVMRAIESHGDLTLEVVAFSTSVLDRYGDVSELIEREGFQIAFRVFSHYDGETPLTMARSAGSALSDLAQVYEMSQPDYVLVVGDRYEVLSAAIAAAYMNIRVAHTMGGELTGTIDESVRHAISKLAHIHFPSTLQAATRLASMGEVPENIHLVGCPRIDVAAEISAGSWKKSDWALTEGVGSTINLRKPFIMVSQHPVTTEFGSSGNQITATLDAVARTGIPAVVLWPNSDAGGADLSASIRVWRERNPLSQFRFIKNLPAEKYMRLMTRTLCLVGNSSSGLREGSFLGTPVVNIGSRQANREAGPNVVHSGYDPQEIHDAISLSIEPGRFGVSHLYGSGGAGKAIADILASSPMPSIQKHFHSSEN